MTARSRVIVVSNRLPVALKADAGGHALMPSAGGLATALRAWHRHAGGPWVGWPGHAGSLDGETFAEARDAMGAQDVVPVELSDTDVAGYYEDFSNGVLWPLFHYLLDRVPVGEHHWLTYQRVNKKFADAVAACYRPGDRVWVHDYHLMLVPRMLRERVPDARIGFFLHVPFPSSEVFRILPWRAAILDGMLGADVIAMHTYGYVRHFAMAALHILGIEPDVDRLRYRGREVRLKALPIGIDGARFAALAATSDVKHEVEAIRRDAGGRRILLGVDRLDYTKGLPRRLLAVERLLARPEWRDRLRFIQLAVPTRGRVESYRGFRRTVEQIVGRINGECGTLESLPVHYLHATVPLTRLVALYLAADVMLVTPLRDGLNLVAKEFVAARVDNDGVLVLSEFAGAAGELGEALVVNPYDVDGLAGAIEQALTMSESERAVRMRALRAHVLENTVDRWADAFIGALDAAPATALHAGPVLTPRELQSRTTPLQRSTPLILVLDYDGTLQPITPTPDLARPDDALLCLLRRVASRPDTVVHVISGRPRETLERWLGELPVELWAEHGFWHRHGGEWTAVAPIPEGWRDKVAPIVAHFTAATPGSLTELKSASLAWHYRLADPEFGARQAHELRMVLGDALSNQPIEVHQGKKAIELRIRGVHKGLPIAHIVETAGSTPGLIAVGDDTTDEDMFTALPAGAVGVHVGDEPSHATYRLANPAAVREWLNLVADGGE
jgi:trehalose 6-phosphate synthase/phosphatase